MTRPSLLSAFLVFLLSAVGGAAPKWENVQHHESRRTWVGMGVDAGNNVYVNAYGGGVTGWNDYFTRKITAGTGVQAWEQIYGAKTYGGGESRGFAVDAAGNSYVTGYDGWAGSDGRKAFNLTLQYLPSGKSGWTKKAGDPKNGGHGVKVDAQGNIFLGGLVGNTPKNPINNDINVVKYSAKGKLLWRRSVAGPNGGHDSFDDFQFDADGNVIVLGRGSDGVLVAKLAGATGNLLWVKTFTKPSSLLNGAADMGVGGNGDIALIGATESQVVFAGNPKVVTLKLSGADGSTKWEKVRGLGWRAESGNAVVMDSDGKVFTAARTSNGSSYDEWRITCHGSDEGDIVWEKVHVERGEPCALALTNEGALVVTGTAGNALAPGILRTEIYEKDYGLLLREDLWQSTIGELSIPSPDAVMIAPSGDILVAGCGTSGDWDEHGGHAVICYPPAPPIPVGKIEFESATQPSVPVPSGVPMDFGPTLHGATWGESKAIILTNKGPGGVKGLAMEVTGPHADQFWVPAGLSPTFYPGGTWYMAIFFLPRDAMVDGVMSKTGPRHATLRITGHGQGDEPFEIPLSGISMTGTGFIDEWAASHGAPGGVDTMPHGDGVSNLMKYAFNMDPTRPDAVAMTPGGSSGLPLVRFVKERTVYYLEVEYLMRKDRGLSYVVKTSNSLDPATFTDPGNWSFYGSADIDSEWRRVKQRLAWEPTIHRKVFARVDVQLESP